MIANGKSFAYQRLNPTFAKFRVAHCGAKTGFPDSLFMVNRVTAVPVAGRVAGLVSDDVFGWA